MGIPRLTVSCLVLVLWFVGPLRNVDANGYPPFGAWAYGTDSPSVNVISTRTVFHASHYRTVGVWGSYGLASPVYFRSAHVDHPYAHALLHKHAYYSRWYATPWNAYVATWPRIVYPAHFYYVAPVTYYKVVPSICCPSPVCGVSNDPLAPTLSVSHPSLSSSSATLSGAAGNSISSPSIAPAQFLDTSFTAQSSEHLLAQISLSVSESDGQGLSTHRDDVPAELVAAADSILKAGGYEEAATAYARLAVRYGASPQLLTRRFLARVLSRDFDQAEVIASLASFSDFPLTAESLHPEGLHGFIDSSVVLAAATEAFAARVLTRTNDPIALRAMATWMQLLADQSRANMFFAAANQIENAPPTLYSTMTPSSDKFQVSFE